MKQAFHEMPLSTHFVVPSYNMLQYNMKQVPFKCTCSLASPVLYLYGLQDTKHFERDFCK